MDPDQNLPSEVVNFSRKALPNQRIDRTLRAAHPQTVRQKRSMTTKQSYWWYVPIVLVMFLGYGLGGCLVFGLHFLAWVPSLTDSTARLVLKLFGMGMLGSAMYCTKWWAKDMEEAMSKPEFLPHAFDCFGYSTTIVGGGITGTVLYMAVRSGVLLTMADPSGAQTRLSFALFVAFCGGLFHFKVKDWFETAIGRMLKKKG